MLLVRFIDQQAAQTDARSAKTAGEHTTPPSGDELRTQIREQFRAVRAAAHDAELEAAQEAAQDGANQANQVHIVRGVPLPPRPPAIHTTSDAGEFATMVMPQIVDVANGFFVMCAVMVVGWPLARAFGRRLERRGSVAATAPGLSEQLQRIEQAVDAMSIEVERISESQRFMAKLQNVPLPEHAALPANDRR
jgi:hypothetical protein